MRCSETDKYPWGLLEHFAKEKKNSVPFFLAFLDLNLAALEGSEQASRGWHTLTFPGSHTSRAGSATLVPCVVPVAFPQHRQEGRSPADGSHRHRRCRLCFTGAF